jgi:hypothetical protein
LNLQQQKKRRHEHINDFHNYKKQPDSIRDDLLPEEAIQHNAPDVPENAGLWAMPCYV